MSYILDALRRADAERERGSVPGLHTQPVPPASTGAPPRRRRRPPAGAAVVAGAIVLGMVALGWRWLESPSPPPEVERLASAPAAGAAAPAPPSIAADVAAPATDAPAPAAPPRAAERVPAAAPSVMLPAPPVPATRPVPLPPSVAAARQAAAPPPAPASAAAASTATASPAPAAEERVYALQELPDAVRRDWPSLAIGGSIYSETPASRFLIINGRIFHEGDAVAKDLSLEQIRLKAAVLRYKGYRVRINY